MTISHEILGMSTSQGDDLAILNERLIRIDDQLIRIETKVTQMYDIFCKLYEAYENMSKSPMMATLMGKMGK